MRSALNFVCRPVIVNLNHVILHSYLQYEFATSQKSKISNPNRKVNVNEDNSLVNVYVEQHVQ